jgi:hypothetical protein
MGITLAGPQMDTLERLIDKGWQLILFKAHPHQSTQPLFKSGCYGAGFVDEEGNPSSEVEDYEYGFTLQEAILKAIRRWEDM